MSSVIETLIDGDIIYEVMLDQPESLYELSISDSSPTYEVINFEVGMLSLALIDDSVVSSFKAYSSFKVSELLTGYSLINHNHNGVYQPYDVELTSWAGISPTAKQDTLESGTNIKTINGTSLLGAGDIVISGGGSINYGLLNNSIIQTGGSF